MSPHHPNIEILEQVAERLRPLLNDLVFLGGCATGLLITDPGAPDIRMTQDVDVITKVSSLSDYYALANRLRQQGFAEDLSDGAPVCRWGVGKLILDVMPTDSRILGFGNQWYLPAIRQSVSMALPSGQKIRCVSAPYFLATKLEAFDGRGEGDFMLSHDVEDIVAVIDGRSEIVAELKEAPKDLVMYLAVRFGDLLGNRSFLDSLPGHLPPDQTGQARISLVEDRIRTIAVLKEQ